MSILHINFFRQTSSLLVLGFIVTHTGHAMAAERDAAGRPDAAPDSRSGVAQHQPPRSWVRTLPPRIRPRYHGGRSFYFHDGYWYERGRGGYVIVRPPIGLYVPAPPPYYTTIWAGGVPYYYVNDTYYRWVDSRRSYEIVGQPVEVVAPGPVSPPPVEEALAQSSFDYPAKGQSAEQQSTDRYECHTWSRNQTGFDPTQPGGGVAAVDHGSRSGEYQRAVNACLEARGYSVK